MKMFFLHGVLCRANGSGAVSQMQRAIEISPLRREFEIKPAFCNAGCLHLENAG